MLVFTAFVFYNILFPSFDFLSVFNTHTSSHLVTHYTELKKLAFCIVNVCSFSQGQFARAIPSDQCGRNVSVPNFN